MTYRLPPAFAGLAGILAHHSWGCGAWRSTPGCMLPPAPQAEICGSHFAQKIGS